ncbi:Cna B-type domain-containing protein [Bifidobacterium criceti]|uniref:Adhesin n=1 Tax=Bifidobacterium criceti TaxID=1960969 RepID=A0A2A2EGJ6_9BIFI|nr:Cna B-type domain-containing protein [Bifidobacterium criceti]PAU68110.1 adhesin [Bifidobacterium criceti]
MERLTIGKRIVPAMLGVGALIASFAVGMPSVYADDTADENVQDSITTKEDRTDLAATVIAGDGEGTINVSYAHDSAALEGVVFHLYNVAKWANEGGYEPIGDFADTEKYPVNWDVLNADPQTFRDMANTLAGYIEVNGTKPAASAMTDADGNASFTQVGDGMFLVTADRFVEKTIECKSSAMLVALPNVHVEDGANQRVVNIEPKSDCVVPEVKTESLNVKKVWKDAGNTDRPKSITVELLKNGEAQETVELSDANNWQHTWSGLESGNDWKVVEKSVPSGYTTISDYDMTAEDEASVTITNTKPAPPVTPPTPPAQTGADIALVAVVAGAALVLGVLLIVKSRKKEA